MKRLKVGKLFIIENGERVYIDFSNAEYNLKVINPEGGKDNFLPIQTIRGLTDQPEAYIVISNNSLFKRLSEMDKPEGIDGLTLFEIFKTDDSDKYWSNATELRDIMVPKGTLVEGEVSLITFLI